MKFSSPQAKADFIKNGVIVRALFANVKQDHPGILSDLFNTLRYSILQDEGVPRANKNFLLNDQTLANIAGLYRKESPPALDTSAARVDLIAHDFLTFACSDFDAGVLRPSSGFYPPGTEPRESADQDINDESIDLGLDSIPWYNRFDSHVPVSNTALSKFLKLLKPYSNQLECELVTFIFNKTPELLAEYFKSTEFSFEPKLTSTWIGYLSFLFATVNSELPPHFSHQDSFKDVPPPLAIIIEHILPAPMTRQTMTRCLKQKSDLIRFAAVRLLSASLQKLQNVLEQFGIAIKQKGTLWREGRQRLLDEFIQRFPEVKDIISTSHQAVEQNTCQSEAIFHLLSLCYKVIPHVTLEHYLDVSLPLNKNLESHMSRQNKLIQEHQIDPNQQDEDRVMDQHESQQREEGLGSPPSTDLLQGFQLQHLLQIAKHAANTRWFHKPPSLQFSPFICLIQISLQDVSPEFLPRIHEVLSSIVNENDMFQTQTQSLALDALLSSLIAGGQKAPQDEALRWLDDVIQRFIKRPIKYLDDLEAVCIEMHVAQVTLSPLWMTLLEQWPYEVDRGSAGDSSHFQSANFLLHYLNVSKMIGEHAGVLDYIRENCRKAKPEAQHLLNEESTAQQIRQDIESQLESVKNRFYSFSTNETLVSHDSAETEHIAWAPPDFAAKPLLSETSPSTTLHAPLKYATDDLADAINTGTLSNLMLCLSSTDHDVRGQALLNIKAFGKRLAEPRIESYVPSAKQIWLLLGILVNTANGYDDSSSKKGKTTDEDHVDEDRVMMPHLLTTFASMAAPLLMNPKGKLYEPINKFLLSSPSWKAERLLRWWLQNTIRQPPAFRSSSSTRKHAVDSTPNQDEPETILSIPPSPMTTSPAKMLLQNQYHIQLHFLVSLLYHSVRSHSDIGILRRSTPTLESLLTLCSGDVYLPRGLRELIVALLWRITTVQEGSDMLITRCGIISWLESLITSRGVGKGSEDLLGRASLKLLLKEVWQNCNQERATDWSCGNIDVAVRRVLE